MNVNMIELTYMCQNLKCQQQSFLRTCEFFVVVFVCGPLVEMDRDPIPAYYIQ